MAERRMFAKTIIDSDAFLDMPHSTQLLYFHLAMRADDDGFINNAKSIMRNVGCKEDDMKVLAVKKFIILFENGVIVIKHWRIHNYIQKDRYNTTKYKGELERLTLDENKAYTLENDQCIQNVYTLDTQVRLGKVRLELGKDKVRADKPPVTDTVKRFSPPKLEEVSDYCKERNNGVDAQRFVDFYASKGWKVGNTPMKDWKACVRTWERRDKTMDSPQKIERAHQKFITHDFGKEDVERILTAANDFSGNDL